MFKESLLDVWCVRVFWIVRRRRDMEEIKAAMYQKMKISGKQIESGQREHIIRWFEDTQAVLLLCDGHFPPWFQGFISRQEAEDRLRDLNVGCFLIRLSEKNIGYILSYKGQDRCRHFVINQTRTGLLIVSGDCTTHNSLKELIDHFKTTPIQPFGEYLTFCYREDDFVEEDSKNEVYDVVQSKPSIKLGVSVKALKSLWEQTSDVYHEQPPVMLSRSNRKLTTSTSFDRDSLTEQAMRIPPIPKKNAPLRNSLSADFVGQHPSYYQQSLFETMTSGKTGVDEKKERDSWVDEGGNYKLQWQDNGCIPPVSIQTNSPNWSMSTLDKNIEKSTSPFKTFDQCDPMSSSSPPSTVPPRTASYLYALLDFKNAQTGADKLPHKGHVDLQSNPLYQSVCVEKDVQTESDYDNHKKTLYKTLLFENTYQDIPDQHDNDTYEHIPEIHGNNTFEDIPRSDTNTYASLEEMQSHMEKKNQKWWKFLPESKKK